MTRDEVVTSVALDLNATEQSLDEAITRATTLVQSIIGSRTGLGLSPVVAADAQTKALEAITALSAARQALVTCHDELAKDHRRLGWGVYAGGWMPKTETAERPPSTGEHRLRAV